MLRMKSTKIFCLPSGFFLFFMVMFCFQYAELNVYSLQMKSERRNESTRAKVVWPNKPEFCFY